MRQKASLLAEALSRINKERGRRAQKARKADQATYARKALALRRSARSKPQRPDPGRTAGTGLNPVENEKAPRIGSPMEAGRVSQFVRDAQGARDNRG